MMSCVITMLIHFREKKRHSLSKEELQNIAFKNTLPGSVSEIPSRPESQQHFLGYLASLSAPYLSIFVHSYQLLMLHFLKQSIKAQKRWSGRTLGMKQELTAHGCQRAELNVLPWRDPDQISEASCLPEQQHFLAATTFLPTHTTSSLYFSFPVWHSILRGCQIPDNLKTRHVCHYFAGLGQRWVLYQIDLVSPLPIINTDTQHQSNYTEASPANIILRGSMTIPLQQNFKHIVGVWLQILKRSLEEKVISMTPIILF